MKLITASTIFLIGVAINPYGATVKHEYLCFKETVKDVWTRTKCGDLK